MPDPQTRPLGAEISHMLKARGVDVIFGIPGVHNQELYRDLHAAGITHVLARHEQGAGFMADGYARASGKPGVAYVITGPGLCNIMTPMGQAYSDSVPMLVISSGLDETGALRGQLHQMKDQEGAAATVCDWSQTARTPHAAYTLIDRAFDEFETQRPRPKHLQLPIKTLSAPAPEAPLPPMRAVKTQASQAEIAPVLSLLNLAQRPLFILGGGAKSDLWRQILLQTGAACFTTYAGRGLAGGNYALDFGATLARPGSADMIASADLVIAVGTELSEVDLWRRHLGHDATFVRVDLDPESLSDPQRATIKLQADAESFAKSLWAATETHSPATGWDPEDVALARSRWHAEAAAERPQLLPVIEALQAAMPEDTMIYSDMTQLAYLAKEVWPMDRPGHWHHPYGFGTLGYALPAAIGGAIARPGQRTLAMIGDYGLQYTMAELSVAVELNLPLPILLWDNDRLQEIEDSMRAAQIAPTAVQARNPDFLALARAFGAEAHKPARLSEIAPLLQAAFSVRGPTLIQLTPELIG